MKILKRNIFLTCALIGVALQVIVDKYKILYDDALPKSLIFWAAEFLQMPARQASKALYHLNSDANLPWHDAISAAVGITFCATLDVLLRHFVFNREVVEDNENDNTG